MQENNFWCFAGQPFATWVSRVVNWQDLPKHIKLAIQALIKVGEHYLLTRSPVAND